MYRLLLIPKIGINKLSYKIIIIIMTSVAICYWGLTRSTKKVYSSHIEHVFNSLKEESIVYDIFMHTWTTDRPYIWNDPTNTPIDYEEYKLLNPNYYQIDKQDDFLKTITFSDYYYEQYANSQKEWLPQLIKNHVCALESQKRVTDMVLNANKKYDYVIYLRPDVEIHSKLRLSYFPIYEKSISIPDNNHWDGYNDRFAITKFADCSYYGKRIDEIIEYRKNHGKIVSETYTRFTIDKYFGSVNFVPFLFDIIRP